MKGAVERILKLCRNYYSYGSLNSMTPKQEQLYLAKAAHMGTSGLRGTHKDAPSKREVV